MNNLYKENIMRSKIQRLITKIEKTLSDRNHQASKEFWLKYEAFDNTYGYDDRTLTFLLKCDDMLNNETIIESNK